MMSAVGGGRGVPKKQTKGTQSADFFMLQGEEGVKKSQNFAYVIYGSPLGQLLIGKKLQNSWATLRNFKNTVNKM